MTRTGKITNMEQRRGSYASMYRNVCSVFLILMPIIGQYRIIPVSPSLMFCMLIFLLYIFRYKKIAIENVCIPYIVYVIVMTGFLSLSFDLLPVNTLVSKYIGFLLVFIAFYCMMPKLIEFDYTLNIYQRVAVFVCVLTIFQYIMHYLMGIRMTFLIPNIMYGNTENMNTSRIIAAQISSGRYSSVFLEPAHLVEFCLPALGWVLFPVEKKYDLSRREYIKAIIISLGMVMTTSMLGIAGVASLWMIFFVSKHRKTITARRLVIVFAVVIAGIFFSTQPIIQEQIHKKLRSAQHLANTGTSLYMRVIAGWACFKDMPIYNKIVGCGYGNAALYILGTGIGLSYYRYTAGFEGYMSGLSNIFFDLGIIGAVLYFRMLYKKIGKIKRPGNVVQVFCILLILGTSASFEQLSSLLSMIILFSRNIYNENNDYLSEL